ncbi:MAG: hypothetical protein J6328_05995 [Bacilli bacterium]|nr:hypothetical protein [Bacilli bacterium]
MSKYATSYIISNQMLTLVADIMERIGKLSDPHSNHSIMVGREKAKLPDPYDQEAYISYFVEGKKIGADAKRILPWAKKQEKKVHPLILAAVCSYSLNVMTPLEENEFHIAILYSQAILASYRPVFAYLPLESVFAAETKKRAKALEDASSDGVMARYIIYFLQMVNKSIEDVEKEITGFEGRKSPCVRKLLDVMRLGQEYSSLDLMNKLGLKSRVAVKRNYLEPALKGGYIKMSIPNKPHSPNQRYSKKRVSEQ